MLYFLAGLIGFIVAKLLVKPITSPFFADVVLNNVQAGKQVAILVDTDATIFRMKDNRLQIIRGKGDMSMVTEDGEAV